MVSMSTYRTDIEGLRAIAVLMVLVFHFDLLPFAGGFTGVDVFFVISGFLITSIIKRQLDDGSFSLSRFYLNRIRRLAPSLLLTTGLVTVAGVIFLLPIDLVELSKQIFAAQTYTANFYYWKTINYFGISHRSAFLLHTWSLAVEEQFYLLYPLFLIIVFKYARRHFWTAIGLCLFASFGLNVAFVATKPEATFYLLPTRAWELLIGAIAVLVHQKTALSKLGANTLSATGLALILSGFFFYDPKYLFPGSFALFPTIGTAFVIVAGKSSDTLLFKFLSAKLMRYLGRISYPLYLVHWPLSIFVIKVIDDHPGIWLRIGAFAASVLLAGLLYHFAEKPLQNTKLTPRRTAVGYVGSTGVILFICGLILLDRGVPGRFPEEVTRLASFENDKSQKLRECEFSGRPIKSTADLCRIGEKNIDPKWIIYGDSHAWAAYGAFDEWLKQIHQSGLFVFRHSCPPLGNISLFRDPLCRSFNDQMLKLIETAGVGNILLVSTWRQAAEGKLSVSSDTVGSLDDSTELFRASFPTTIKRIKDAGSSVYIWEPVPGAKESVPSALAKALLHHRQAEIEFTSAEYKTSADFFFKAVQNVRGLVTATFSPSKALCETGSCKVAIEGDPVYFDNSHLVASSSKFWADQLRKQLTP
jgi:peptidoglycan/LPS O-acetylase OafA/YrhL